MVRIFLPYVEIFWKCLPASLKQIKAAGFDGVECHLIGRLLSQERIRILREEIAEQELDVRFHQGWSWETGQRNLYNAVLRPLNALVPVGLPLTKQVSDVGSDPVVVYGNTVIEASQPNYLYQTCSEHVHGSSYAMAFTSFANAVKSYRLPVVFDTQHVLEWFLNKENVAGLPEDPAVIEKMVVKLWEEFQPLVREIHLCDFNPLLGPSHGRNVFPGTGIFPLQQFSEHVRASHWSGIVTPEVSPQHLRGKDKLRVLREKVDHLFN